MQNPWNPSLWEEPRLNSEESRESQTWPTDGIWQRLYAISSNSCGKQWTLWSFTNGLIWYTIWTRQD
jgi:hypothetical protein